MAAAIGLREDFDAKAVRALAKRAKDGPRARRLLALAAIYDGATRSEAAKIGGVTLQVVRDWVLRFNALGPEGLVDRKAPGQPSLLNEEQRAALARIVEEGPTPAIHGVVRWRIVDHRDLVFRRSPRRPEEQDHAALGQARLAPLGAQGPAHRFDLHLRRDLAQGRQRRSARPAQMRHLCDELALG